MNIKKIFFLIINTMIIFAPVFRIFPKWTWLVAGIGLLCIFDKKMAKKMGYTSKKFFLLLTLIGAAIIISMCIPILYGTYDYTYTPLLIGLMLCVFRAVFLSYIFQKFFRNNATVDYYVEFFIKSCVVYFAFTILFIIVPEFKEFWMSRIIIPVEGSDYIAYKYRYSLDGFAAFGSATIFSLAILLNSYLIIVNRELKKRFYKNVITYILICIGCFFYGRISIFAMALSFIYLFVFYGNKKRIRMLLFDLIIAFGILFAIIMKLAQSNPDIRIWTNWAFEFIVSLFKGDIGGSYSVSHMFEDMYFIPSLKTIMFGDGRYKALLGEGYYMSTDVGFMRPLLFFGIIGLSINYSMLILMLKKMYSFFRYSKNKPGKLLIISIFLLTIVLEMKGEAFHRILYCIVPIYFSLYYECKKEIVGNIIKDK